MFDKNNQPFIISETTPLVVWNLSVFPNRLKYKERVCHFKDIISLSWYWRSQTINLVNTQQVKLGIYIFRSESPIIINNTTMYVTPKLVTAYNFIAKETYEKRLRKYSNKLEEFGRFKYQDVFIYSDGRVIKNDKIFFLKNAQYNVFNISIKQGGLFSSRCNIDTTLDHDVILALLNYIQKNPQDSDSIRKNAQSRKKATETAGSYLPKLICMLAKLAKADGFVAAEEIEVIKRFFLDTLKLDDKSYKVAISIFNEAKDSPEPIEFLANNILKDIGNNKALLINIVNLLFSIAIADGHLSAEEELMINEVETIFGVTGQTEYSAFRKEHKQRGKSQGNGDARYYEILGLNINTDPSEIKITYRRLVMQYHPDRVQHLGAEFKAMAEEKIKEINMAYEYFQKKYNI